MGEMLAFPANLTPAWWWRLIVTKRRGSNVYSDITELAFLDLDGVDVTAGGLPVASSSHSAPYIAAKAFDKDAGTYWHSAPESTPPWIKYRFPTPVLPGVVEITSGVNVPFLPENYAIQRSDDSVVWEDVLTVVGDTAWTTRQKRVFYLVPMAGLSGNARLANGDPAERVIATHVSGGLKKVAMPAADGSYSMVLPVGEFIVSAIGPAGYRPVSHLVEVS